MMASSCGLKVLLNRPLLCNITRKFQQALIQDCSPLSIFFAVMPQGSRSPARGRLSGPGALEPDIARKTIGYIQPECILYPRKIPGWGSASEIRFAVDAPRL
jgi:hypothetical protein